MPRFVACELIHKASTLSFATSKTGETTMTPRPKHYWILLALIYAIVFTSSVPGIARGFGKHLKGSINGELYISKDKDFRVVIPVYEPAGGKVRDEFAVMEDAEISQVIFTDDFGSFYRILSIKTQRTMDDLHVFRDIREQKTIYTEWGRTFRVIDVEKEGAEIVVTNIENGGPAETSKPDMITANVIFTANNRIYHLVAGVPVIRQRKFEDLQAIANARLDHLMAKFQTLEPEKSKKKK
jgi:hypothetical protein